MMIHLLLLLFISHVLIAEEWLPSWNEGSAKQRILQFAEKASTPGDPQYIPQADRIATFDQDGTLWVEHPIYTQFLFAMDRVKGEAAKHPEWTTQEPFRSILEGDMEKIQKFSMKDIEQLLAETHTGMTVEAFDKEVLDWLKTAKHPRFDKPFTALIYQPMLEAIQLLKEKGFKVYIVSGGGQGFIRTYADKVYGIPSEQIIGTSAKVRYDWNNGHPELTKIPELLYIDDHAGKPEAIYLIIGKPPVIAFGNSDGDQQMLEWTTGGKQNRLGILIHHDDPVREYAYDTATKVGTFSQALMKEANQEKWVVVSMKDDWKVIFPEDK